MSIRTRSITVISWICFAIGGIALLTNFLPGFSILSRRPCRASQTPRTDDTPAA
ncbi:MAG TPA: hypothetical protein VMU04_04350 [Candidatus Acidoferrum sp.]|nr:hypothetical protein [Candidatus Acidoferrum sp.]